MKVLSKELRTITIEGVEFTPDSKGVEVPTHKEKAVKSNFFFKHYIRNGSFTVAVAKKETSK